MCRFRSDGGRSSMHAADPDEEGSTRNLGTRKRKRSRPGRRSATASLTGYCSSLIVLSASVLSHLLASGGLHVAAAGANPYASGCLRAKLGSERRVRVCNSDDASAERNKNGTSTHNTSEGRCAMPEFDYPEIRIAPGNWESSIFQSFIMQIALSEILGVPCSIESGSRDVLLSFYDESNAFPYPNRAYGWDDLKTANAAPRGDCTYVLDQVEDATCAHILPEVWAGQRTAWTEARTEGFIEPPEGTVTVGKLSWYLPRFVVAQDPSLATYLGLRGEENRRRLAETFLRPTTWLDYCNEVSETNCVVPDEVAQRAPTLAEIEEGTSNKYRLEGAYTGYFRKTPQNDCSNSTACTGHIVDAPCTWSTNVNQQLYWNDIHLESNGPLEPNNGHTYGDMLDIWEASVETRSPVMMWWWYPDATVQKYEGTPGEFHPIVLPDPTEECRDSRIGSDERCSDDVWVRRGNEEGKCDEEAHSMKRIIASSVGEETFKANAAERSPGYQTIQNIAIDNLNLETMLGAWVKNGYDAREAVCGWVAANLDKVMDFVPRGHPRSLVVNSWYGSEAGLLYAAMAIGAIAIVLVVLSSWTVYKYRTKRIIRNSQVDFLFLVLFGCLLVGVAGIIYTLEPGRGTCTAKEFLIMLGFTFVMVPLLVKIEAILWIQRAGKRMKRVKLRRSQLYELVAVFVVTVLCYLIAWAVVDPPKREEFLTLPDVAGTKVVKSVQCASNSAVWKLVEYLWEFLLIIIATLLAYQARHVRQEFNESELLYRLCYVQFFLLVLRAMIFFLQQAGYIAPTVEAGVTSLFLSFSSISALGLYFGPKFYLLKHGDDAAKRIVTRLGSNVSCWESVHAPTGLGGRRSSNFSDYSAARSVYSSTEEQDEPQTTTRDNGDTQNFHRSTTRSSSIQVNQSNSHSSHRRKQRSLARLQDAWRKTYDRASSRNNGSRKRLVTTQGVSQRMIGTFLGEGSNRAVVEKKENVTNKVISSIAEKGQEEKGAAAEQERDDSNGTPAAHTDLAI